MNRMTPSTDMGGLDRELLGIVDHIYAAALDPAQWVDVMDNVVRLLDGVSGNCAVLRPRNQAEASFWAASRNTPTEILASYIAYYHQKDVLLDAIERRPDLAGVPIMGRNLISRNDFSKTEIYNDFLKPGGAEDVHALAIPGRTMLAPMTVINVIKPGWSESEDERAIYVFTKLKPHLERAIGLHWQLEGERLRNSMSLNALDMLRTGVVMLDRTGAVLMMNRTAEAMLAKKDGLMLSHRRILAQNRSDAVQLEKLISVTMGAEPRLDRGGTMAIRRPSGARPFIVSILPAQDGSPAQRFGTCLLFIKDPDDTPKPDANHLRRLFGLSPAEARLCAALAAGKSMQEFAGATEITLNTAKTHLRNVFTKTETSRQADLVRLMLASLPQIKPVDGEDS